MRIAILSRNRSLYSTRRLAEAARERGHNVSIIDTVTVAIEIGGDREREEKIKVVNPRLAAMVPLLRGKSQNGVIQLPAVDAIIPRIGARITYYGLAVVRQFETRGVLTTAASQAIAQSRDKLHSLQIMNQAGLPIPKTAIVNQPAALISAVKAVGGPPVIIKLIRGTQGRGVILARNLSTAEAVLDKLKELRRKALVQEFVAEAQGKDQRIIVVGDRCVAAMERAAPDGEFRANLHLGGTAVPYTPDKATEALALAATRAHGLSVAGVDIIHSRRGPLLLEVNSSPGLEGIEQVTQIDIATQIIRFLEQSAARKKRPPSRKHKKGR